MIKKLLACIALLTIYCQSFSQEEIDSDKIKFGKIEPEEFETKSFGKDSAASAIVLFDIGYVNFGINIKGKWTYTFERHRRVKILNKEGLEYGNFEIPIYHSKTAEEKLNKVQVASYNLVNGKIVQNKAAKDEKFQDKYNESYTNYKYTLSNVQEGTILEIKYQIESDIIYTLRDWYFQREIPTVYSEFALNLPEYFQYKIVPQNFHPIKLASDKSIQATFAGYVAGEGTERGDAFNFSCEASLRKWVSTNIPAFKNESFITTDDDYITKLGFEIQATKFPNSPYKSYSGSWEQVVTEYSKAEKFGEFIKPNGATRKMLLTVIKENDPEIEKAQKIFDFVKSSVKWNGRNSDYASQTNVKSVFEAKTGNIGDINLSLLTLLKSADLDASPLILSTRSNGKHPGYPLASKFNYVIVMLNCDSSSYFLDASNINNSFNLISYNALNHQGFLLDFEKLSGKWINMDPNSFSTSSIMSNITFDENLVLKGSTAFRKTNYEAMNARRKYQNFTSEADYLKDYSSNKNGLKIISYKQEQFKDLDLPAAEIFEFEIEDYIEQAGNLVYFNPLMYEKTKENPLKNDTRNFPIDFAYPRSENYRLVVNLPDGYEVDKLPESINFKLADNSASFLYTCIRAESQILITSKIIINSSVYSPDGYPDLKELFKQIVAKQNQPLVLRKL